MKVKGSEMQIPLKLEEARSSRDALAKAVYLKLFGWVVSQVTICLLNAPRGECARTAVTVRTIGVCVCRSTAPC